MSDVTSAQIKTDTWEQLNAMKKPGDSMDDVINRLLEEYKSARAESDGGRDRAAAQS